MVLALADTCIFFCQDQHYPILKLKLHRNEATNTGNMLLPAFFQRLFDNILVKVNINHVGTHSLRHSFATNLINSGAEIKIVSCLLDHSSITLTYNTYIHTNIDLSFSAVSLLDLTN